QSPWYSVTVVHQIRLETLELRITAQGYTRQETQSLLIKAADLSKTVVTAPQGSRVELSAVVDIPVGGAMLEVAGGQPASMESSANGRRFSAVFMVFDETPIAILLTQGKQIVGRLPEESLVIHCIKDQPPTIE